MTIPEELKRSTPRDVSMTRAGWKAILWPSLISVCIVIGMQAPNSKQASGVLFVLGWWRDHHSLLDLSMILLGAGIGWMRYRRQTNLMMYGRAAVASVTRYDKPSSHLFMRRLRVEFEFRLLNGSFCTTSANLQGAEIPDLDAEIIIIYDLDDPKRPYSIRRVC
jgi:hypothetical protein